MSNYALIKPDGAVMEMRGLLPDYSNIQCFLKRPPTDAEIASILPLVDVAPAYDPATQTVEEGDLTAFSDRVERGWNVRTLTALELNTPLLAQIAKLEISCTARRWREFTMGIDKNFIPVVDAQIAALRAQLK